MAEAAWRGNPCAAHSLLRLGTGPSLSSLSLSLLRSKARGVPSVARPFTGQRVPRILCNAPVDPWLGRSPGRASTGPSSIFGSPPEPLAYSASPLSCSNSPSPLAGEGWGGAGPGCGCAPRSAWVRGIKSKTNPPQPARLSGRAKKSGCRPSGYGETVCALARGSSVSVWLFVFSAIFAVSSCNFRATMEVHGTVAERTFPA